MRIFQKLLKNAEVAKKDFGILEFRHILNTAMKPFFKHAPKICWLSVSQILQPQSGPKRDFPLTKEPNTMFCLGFFFVLGLFCSAVEESLADTEAEQSGSLTEEVLK